ncbi:hypothetical protein E2558_05250 [Staphylococcus pragensis]|uniref:PepSY domain-containing protein n=1 Tax=Staphylococcus pragensis TaxID=1611836 RepID=A0A4Z1B5G7_9STAP|nr:PepSY domain-containing protein [Staphylococcus pragensis]RTX88622.1 hypothetical protein CD154_08470 [Staphylococcus carnosus]TGN29053.1 hypothetical protein E2558_05250 [Staphylococcus pragensis]GGG83148.1 peptidase [Staphylococcus pragensis]
MTRQTIKFITIPVVLTVGVSTAILFYYLLDNKKVKQPNKVLDEAKSYFMNIRGSYILHEAYVDNDKYPNRLIYQGGITQDKHNKIIEYIFYADAYTGEILTIEEL